MPTPRDKRRLVMGQTALVLPVDDLAQLTVTQLQQRRRELHDAACAMQSLDDLGSADATGWI